MRKRSLNFARATGAAAAALAAAALALSAAGCGGSDAPDPEARITKTALTGLYAIDHDGSTPSANALAPYTTAFEKLVDLCDGTVEDLASAIQTISFRASNGSGTTVTNLEALRAVIRYLDEKPQPSGDCRGVFVGVEALLQGNALPG